MPRLIQADEHRGISVDLSWDAPLHMYYDETNNIRRLKLSEVGLNAPVDRTFTLAGIALKPEKSLSGWDDLRQAMGIQATAEEIKFKHVAHSDYEAALESRKLSIFLEWIIQSDILVHYSVLDVLYWSVLDIIESLMVDDRFNVIARHHELKNELYFAVTKNPTAFMTLLHGFNYPNLRPGSVKSFLSCIFSFISYQVPKNRNPDMKELKDILRRASQVSELELPFLHNNEPGELVGDFSVHFMHCLYAFKHASHILDRETYIEKIIQQFEIRDGSRLVDYRFVDSEDEIGIQASDVVAGLVGRHFSYVQQHSLPELRSALARFSEQQLKNLGLLRDLIQRSNTFSNGLFHALNPRDTGYKNDFFLHGRPAPSYLG